MSVHPTYAPCRGLLAVLAAGAFTTTLNLTLLSPLLPHIATDFALPEATVGQLGTLTAVTAGLVAILATPLIDRYARRTVLQIESALLVVSTLFAVAAPSFTMLAVSRMLAGAGGAIILGVCVAATADLIPDPARRNRHVGLLTTACALGTIAGLPLLTQVASLWNWRAAIAVMLPLSLLMFAGVTRLPGGAPHLLSAPRPRWPERYQTVIANPVTVALLALVMLQSGIRLGWLVYIGALAGARFGLSAGALSALFIAGGAAEILANNLGPRLIERVPTRPLMLCTVGVLGLSLIGVGVSVAPWSLFLCVVFISLARALLFLVVCILQIDLNPSARGTVMALQSASLEVGHVLGIAGIGLALVVFGDFTAAYQAAGIVALITMTPVAWFACRRSFVPALPAPEPASALQSPVVSAYPVRAPH